MKLLGGKKLHIVSKFCPSHIQLNTMMTKFKGIDRKFLKSKNLQLFFTYNTLHAESKHKPKNISNHFYKEWYLLSRMLSPNSTQMTLHRKQKGKSFGFNKWPLLPAHSRSLIPGRAAINIPAGKPSFPLRPTNGHSPEPWQLQQKE